MKKFILMITLIMSSAVHSKEVVVGLVDNGVYPLNESLKKQTLNLENKLIDFHGTDLACILTRNNKDIKVHSFNHRGTFNGRIEALKEAIRYNVDYILYTSSGEEESLKEKYLLELAVKKGIQVVVSSGNQGKNIDINKEYPCSYKIEGVHCVGNKQSYSNYGTNVIRIDEDNEPRCIQSLKGTSQSAAFYIKELIKKSIN